MSALHTVVLIIGWAVLFAIAVAAVCAAWYGAGELAWRALPERWCKAQFWQVPQPRYGRYVSPGVTGWGLAAMIILGGPVGWWRVPGVVKANREKRRIAAKAACGERS